MFANRSLCCCVCLFLSLGVASGVGCGADSKKGRGHDLFHQGRNRLMQADYDAAATALASYLKKYPNGPLASRASFLLAKADIGLGEYGKSEQQFQETIDAFPDSLEAHKSKYKLGLLALLQGAGQQSLQRFRVVAENPNGPLAPEAQAMVRYLEDR